MYRTMCSPAILELSGIGDKKILEAAGVAPRVHNPAVGENSQEHIFFALKYGMAHIALSVCLYV